MHEMGENAFIIDFNLKIMFVDDAFIVALRMSIPTRIKNIIG